MCRALPVDTGTPCLASDHIHHFLGARELSSLDGFPSRSHYLTCSLYGLPPTQGQSRCGSQYGGIGLHCGGRHLSILLPRSPTIGWLWYLRSLYTTRIRQFSQSHYNFQLYRWIIPGFRSFSQFQALPKRKVWRVLIFLARKTKGTFQKRQEDCLEVLESAQVKRSLCFAFKLQAINRSF